MGGAKQLAAGMVCGVVLTLGIGLLMGSGAPIDAHVIAGVTGYTENGLHHAIAWEAQDHELVPVSRSVVFTSNQALLDAVQLHISELAPKAEDQQELLGALQDAVSASTQIDRDRSYTKAAGILIESSNCSTCAADYRKCKGSPVECVGRLVLCRLTNCH